MKSPDLRVRGAVEANARRLYTTTCEHNERSNTMSNTAKKLNSMKEKLAAVKAKAAKAKESTEKKGAKVLDLKAKLKGKGSKKEASIIANQKEREKLQRFGIEAVAVFDQDFEDGHAFMVKVDEDIAQFTIPLKEDALVIAFGLYGHIKKMAERLTAQALKDAKDE